MRRSNMGGDTDMAAQMTLVLGGMRSGKTAWAEARALALADSGGQGRPVYLATCIARGDDPEMQARINAHKAARDGRFETIESRDIIAAIKTRKSGAVMVIDSIGTWLTNMMMVDTHGGAAVIWERLEMALEHARLPLIFVSEEVGLGIIPDNAMAREFADMLGAINARLAARADCVVLVTAGIPRTLKGDLP